MTLWNTGIERALPKGFFYFFTRTRDISKNLSNSECTEMNIFGQFFFAYFLAFRIKLENPLDGTVSIIINSMLLIFSAYPVIPVLFRPVAINFCSSSPSIMGTHTKIAKKVRKIAFS